MEKKYTQSQAAQMHLQLQNILGYLRTPLVTSAFREAHEGVYLNDIIEQVQLTLSDIDGGK